jgi:hypothetical protein
MCPPKIKVLSGKRLIRVSYIVALISSSVVDVGTNIKTGFPVSFCTLIHP